MDDTDLRDALDRAIGDGPALPTPSQRLTDGQRALRRRRTGVAALAAAAVAAVVVPAAALAGGSPTSGTEPAPLSPATSAPAATEDASEPPQPPRERHEWLDDSVPAEVDPITSSVWIRPNAVVHERRMDVFPGKDTESLALDLTWRGERYWVLLEWDEGGNGGTYTGPDDGLVDSFDAFVAQQVAGGGMQHGSPPGRQLDGSEDPEPGTVEGLEWNGTELVGRGATEILEQRGDVDLGPTFAAESDTTGAALVQMAGERQLVLYRQAAGEEGQLIAVLSDGHGRTLDELLAWARQRYESGAGLL